MSRTTQDSSVKYRNDMLKRTNVQRTYLPRHTRPAFRSCHCESARLALRRFDVL